MSDHIACMEGASRPHRESRSTGATMRSTYSHVPGGRLVAIMRESGRLVRQGGRSTPRPDRALRRHKHEICNKDVMGFSQPHWRPLGLQQRCAISPITIQRRGKKCPQDPPHFVCHAGIREMEHPYVCKVKVVTVHHAQSRVSLKSPNAAAYVMTNLRK